MARGGVEAGEARLRQGLLERAEQGARRRAVGYDSNAELKRMKQLPFRTRTESRFSCVSRAPAYALGTWVVPRRVKAGHETSLNQCFHKSEPMQAMGRETVSLLAQIRE